MTIIEFSFLRSTIFLKLYTFISFAFYLVIFGICFILGKMGTKLTTLKIWETYQSEITPSPWFHYILYILLLIHLMYVIYVIWPVREEEKKVLIKSLGIWLPLTWNFFTAWFVLFAFDFIKTSFGFLILLWVFSFLAYNNINDTYETKMDTLVFGVTDLRTGEKVPLNTNEKAWVIFDFFISYVPTSLVLGYVTFTSVLNLSATSNHNLYVALDISMLCLVVLIALIVSLQRLDPFLCIPVVWGMVAIATKRPKSEVHTATLILGVCMAATSVLVSAYLLFRNYETRKIHEQQQRLLKDDTDW